MAQGILKTLRFIAPGGIFMILFGLLGWITGLWPMVSLGSTKDWAYSLAVLIPAGLYYLTPLRTRSNARYFDTVSENLRSGLVRISGLPDEPEVFTWQALRSVFYHFIDQDKSLSSKALLAYFNGFIWTTVADIRALSIIFILPALLLAFMGSNRALLAVSFFGALALLSIWGSRWTTKLHMGIGNEQLEIIELKYRAELTRMMGDVRDRYNRTGGNDNAGRT